MNRSPRYCSQLEPSGPAEVAFRALFAAGKEPGRASQRRNVPALAEWTVTQRVNLKEVHQLVHL